MPYSRVQAPRSEGIGLTFPERTTSCDGAHPGWFDWIVNNDHICEGEDWIDPLPTERHRRIPDAPPRPEWA